MFKLPFFSDIPRKSHPHEAVVKLWLNVKSIFEEKFSV